MKLGVKRVVEVDARTLSLCLKVRDEFSAQLLDAAGTSIHDQEDGYVPGFMPGEHHGDYVMLDIELETGRITNWKPPTAEQLRAWMKGGDDE
jgi:hypothetical protein